MNTQWVQVPQSSWDLDHQVELRNLKARGFEPTTTPPNIKIIPEADLIEIEVKSIEPV